MQNREFEIVLNGGLGNQLFGWALGTSVARISGFRCRFNASRIEGRPYELAPFGIAPYFGKPYQSFNQLHIATNRLMQKIHFPFHFPSFLERSFNFNPVFLMPKNCVSYYGYFQSYKYFQADKDYIRRFLHESFQGSEKYMQALSRINKFNYFAVHVRRGDYLGKEHFHGLAEKEYFEAARDMVLGLEPSARFILFSDSPELARAEVPWAEYIPEVSEGYSSAETMMIMSATSGIIGSNSSFSWWAAFLQDESSTKIFPKNWFSEKSLNTIDLTPKHWTLI